MRQYSCRIQKEIKIVKYEPCTDAPSAVYGGDARQQDILSDGTGVITIYGLIGKDWAIEKRRASIIERIHNFYTVISKLCQSNLLIAIITL